MPNNTIPSFDEVFQRLVSIINSGQDLTPLTKLTDLGFLDTASLRVFLDGPVLQEFGVSITPSGAGSDLRSLVLAIIAALKNILDGAAAGPKGAKAIKGAAPKARKKSADK